MEFHYGKAPVYYIDGVPGYKAGEWPGLKSNKFGNTRRIIQPKNQGIIFNEKEPLVPPKRKLLCPGPSPEYVFRPCCRMVDESQFDRTPKINSLRVTEQKFIQNKFDYEYEKKHKFDYKIQMEQKKKEAEKNMNLSKFVRNELKLITLVGFTNNRLENLNNKDLYGLKFKKHDGKLQLDLEDPNIQRKQINRQRIADRNYVKNLGEWENKTLKKITEPKPQQVTNVESNLNLESTPNEEKK